DAFGKQRAVLELERRGRVVQPREARLHALACLLESIVAPAVLESVLRRQESVAELLDVLQRAQRGRDVVRLALETREIAMQRGVLGTLLEQRFHALDATARRVALGQRRERKKEKGAEEGTRKRSHAPIVPCRYMGGRLRP